MLYDTAQFVVVHFIANEPATPADQLTWPPRHCFEIVDKTTNMEILLIDSWAEGFQRHLTRWQLNMPHQEEVDATLEGYIALAQLPLVMH